MPGRPTTIERGSPGSVIEETSGGSAESHQMTYGTTLRGEVPGPGVTPLIGVSVAGWERKADHDTGSAAG